MLRGGVGSAFSERGFLRSVHPIAKIVCSLLIFIVCIVVTEAIPLAIYLVLMLGVLLASRMGRLLGRLMLFFGPLALMVALVSWISGNTIGSATISAMRIISIGITIVMFAFTTTPAEFIRSLETLRAPRSITLGFMIALRFIPVFIGEAEMIRQSLRLRGVKGRRGLYFYYRGFFIPLLYRVYTLSDGIALGLHTRGFRLEGERTALRELRFRLQDVAFLGFFLVASVGVAVL